GRHQHFFEVLAHALLGGGVTDGLGHLLLEVGIDVDDVPAHCHRLQLPRPRIACTPKRRTVSTRKKNKAAITAIRNTIAVVTMVSLRLGQVTLAVSCRTCRKNSIGLTLAIAL